MVSTLLLEQQCGVSKTGVQVFSNPTHLLPGKRPLNGLLMQKQHP
jgi:hypothetical protein